MEVQNGEDHQVFYPVHTKWYSSTYISSLSFQHTTHIHPVFEVKNACIHYILQGMMVRYSFHFNTHTSTALYLLLESLYNSHNHTTDYVLTITCTLVKLLFLGLHKHNLHIGPKVIQFQRAINENLSGTD